MNERAYVGSKFGQMSDFLLAGGDKTILQDDANI